MKIDLFRFSSVARKKAPTKTYKEIGQIIHCRVILIDNKFVAFNVNDSNPVPNYYELTPNSYSLKGKTYIFTKASCKTPNTVCFIRTHLKAEQNYGFDEEHYTPIALNWIYKGKLAEYKGKTYFEAHEAIDKYMKYVDRFERR